MPQIVYKNNVIEYTLSRNAKKNVNFRIKPDGEICISAPRRVSKAELEKMIYDKAEWIIASREKITAKKHNVIDKEIKTGSHIFINGKNYIIKIIAGKFNHVYIHDTLLTVQIKENFITSQEYINAYFESWLKEMTYMLTDKYMDIYLAKLNKYHLTKPELSIRNMTSHWGSCIPSKNKITINKNLIYPPHECLEYVVLHELSHLVEANHSKNFYNIIESVMPDWKERKNILNNF